MTEWRPGFAQLVEGKPFNVRRDQGFVSGDVLIVREYDEVTRAPTGMVAIFRITWVARPSDGLCQGLMAEGTVVLGIAPANVVAAVPTPQPEAITSPCCRCGIRTAKRLLRKTAVDDAAPEACPFCAPILRVGHAPRSSRSTVLLAAARAEAGRLRELAGEEGLDGNDLAEVIPVLLSELVGRGQRGSRAALRALPGRGAP